jgi:3-isopropylmalate dehydrogenase
VPGADRWPRNEGMQMTAVRTYVIACLPGDGIGPEVVAEARAAVDAAGTRWGFTVDWVDYDLGAERYLRTGEVLPDAVLGELRQADGILLGAVGRPDVPPGVLERGLLLRLRAELDLFVNLRPVKLYPGVVSPVAQATPDSVDMLVVRENTEGTYAGAGGGLRRGTPAELATQDSYNTRFGVERCVRYAAGLAAGRQRRLTLVHKTNVLTHAGDLWQRTATEVAAEFGVELDYAHVDAACMYFITDPGRFDVIVTDNLFGDILTDLGAAVAGGIGLAASANLHPVERGGAAAAGNGAARQGPSLFEPVHGSAPDIAGSGKANPVAAVLSAGMLLDHLGEPDAAAALESAAVAVLPEAARYSTRELGARIAATVAGVQEVHGEPAVSQVRANA